MGHERGGAEDARCRITRHLGLVGSEYACSPSLRQAAAPETWLGKFHPGQDVRDVVAHVDPVTGDTEAFEVTAMGHPEFEMSSLDYWRFCQVLTVVQAALLIIGQAPSGELQDIERWNARDWPIGYEAVRAALLGDIKRELLPADVPEGRDEERQEIFPLWEKATILVEDLRVWLKSRGVQSGFFFPESQGPDYLYPRHPNYSPKLAAAIGAWVAVSKDPDLRKGKTVKQALDIWLRLHANDFGLTKEDGNPNEQGIQEVAKIANWDPKGGAPKTPAAE